MFLITDKVGEIKEYLVEKHLNAVADTGVNTKFRLFQIAALRNICHILIHMILTVGILGCSARLDLINRMQVK